MRALTRLVGRLERCDRDSLWIFAAATSVRLCFVAFVHPTHESLYSDMAAYDGVARRLLDGDLGPWDAFRPVGYPALLAALYLLTDTSRSVVGLAQAVLGGATAALAHRIALRLHLGRRWSLAAGAAVGLHLPLIFYSGLLLAEVTGAFLLTLGVGLVLRAADDPDGRWALAAGAALGLCATVKPHLVVAWPAAWLYLRLRTRQRPRIVGRALGVRLLVGAAGPLLAALLFHGAVSGHPGGLSRNGGVSFYLNFAPVGSLHYEAEGTAYWLAPIPNLVRHREQLRVDVPFYDEAHYYRAGLAALRERPAALWGALDNLVEAAGVGRQHYWPGWPAYDRVLELYSRVFFGLVVAPALLYAGWFFWTGRYRRSVEAPRLLLLIVAAGVLPAVYLFLGDPRVRVPFDPLLAILAVDGARRLVEARASG